MAGRNAGDMCVRGNVISRESEQFSLDILLQDNALNTVSKTNTHVNTH